MRRFVQSLVVLSAAPVAFALPVLSRPLPKPHAVPPHVAERAVAAVADLAGPYVARPLAAAAGTASFAALGVTWDAGRTGEVEVTARVHQDGGWTGWHTLDADSDDGPDTAGADARTGRVRGGTAPWFTGPADGYQVRVGVVRGAAPHGVRVSLVDPGTSAADAAVGASPILGSANAEASLGMPTYITRAQWGADESLRSGSPDYSDTIKMGFVHHTDTSNSYSMAQAASMVRSVYAFHTQSRGWSDIGYNFLVDKYGRIFEGRYGGVDRPVIGAHTGGFNTDTFGVSLLGTYTSVSPTSAQLGALEKVFAWKLGLHYVNPLARSTLTSRGGTKYDAGTRVTFNNVSGHRDAGLTSCPGEQTYRRLGTIRSAIKSYMGASLYGPTISATNVLYLASTGVTVRAAVPATQSWRLDVRNARSGRMVRQVSGSASTAISAPWNLKDTGGSFVLPDVYTLTLSSWTSRTKARPYVATVRVASPLPSGASVTYATGAVHAFVDNGSLGVVSPALAAALRPSPALVTYSGQRSSMAGVAAAPRDGLFVRSSSSGALYVVVDGYRRPVSSAVVSALGLTAPVSLAGTVLGNAAQGPAWTSTTRHPDGMVVRGADGTAWRIESGVRRPFTSPAAKAGWAKGLAVPVALAGDLALPLGAPLAPREGTVLRTATGAGVVSGGTFRVLSDPGALGYSLTSAPLATSADLSALPTGDPVGTDRHPSGTLLRNGSGYLEVVGTAKRVVSSALLGTDPRVPVAPLTGEVAALTAPRWLPPSGVAGRAADGSVRVVDNGRLVTLAPGVANALGYSAASLPALEAADFGPLPTAPALASTALHPGGSLVTDGSAVWLVDASTRRPVPASLVQTWRGHPALPATPADLALPLGANAPAMNGAWLLTPDGVRWLVDRGVRHPVTATVAKRLGLNAVTPMPVVAADLTAATTSGTAVA